MMFEAILRQPGLLPRRGLLSVRGQDREHLLEECGVGRVVHFVAEPGDQRLPEHHLRQQPHDELEVRLLAHVVVVDQTEHDLGDLLELLFLLVSAALR